MKTLLLVAATILSASSSHARLGETKAQCDARYGPGVDHKGNGWHYNKGGFSIRLFFDRNTNVCKQITYTVQGAGKIDEKMVYKLCEVNSLPMPMKFFRNDKLSFMFKDNKDGKLIVHDSRHLTLGGRVAKELNLKGL